MIEQKEKKRTLDHVIIHFSSSFMCLLARLMIGTVKKRLSLDPA